MNLRFVTPFLLALLLATEAFSAKTPEAKRCEDLAAGVAAPAITITVKEGTAALPLAKIGNAILEVEGARGSLEKVYLISNAAYLKQIACFKMGFEIYTLPDSPRKIIAISNWKNPERMSSHAIIRKAMALANGGVELKVFQKGYLRPRDDGRIEVYDLVGAPIYSYAGYYGSKLSDSAQEVSHAFRESLSVSVVFPSPETDSDSGFNR